MKKTFLFLFFVISIFTQFSVSSFSQTPSLSSLPLSSLERYWQSDHYEKVRVISYNIWNGFDYGKDTCRQDRFVNYIIAQDPEILALQELNGFTSSTLSALAKRWGHDYSILHKEEGYPVGLTSKKPIRLECKRTKGYGHGLLHVKSYDYDIIVTHLNPSNYNTRLMEANNIVAYMQEQDLEERTIVMGDLNAHSPSDADYLECNNVNLLLNRGGKGSINLSNGTFDYSVISTFLSYPLIDICRKYVLGDERMTYPTPILMGISKQRHIMERIGERIDFILVTRDLESDVIDAFIFNTGDVDYLSDHYPIAIDLMVKTSD